RGPSRPARPGLVPRCGAELPVLWQPHLLDTAIGPAEPALRRPSWLRQHLEPGGGLEMRRKPSYLSLTDLFCGAGGASIGAEAAGCKLVLGINHWQRAIETHSANFPYAAHDCRDVSETHPSRYGSTHLLWASPECPTWSQARGRRADQGITGQLGLSE